MSFTKVSVAGIGTTGTITFTNVNVAGVITATSFSGSGANLTGVASTDNIRTNTNATFLQSVNVTGIVTTAGVNASGVITATSSIVGSAVTINASGINATGVITATSFSGSGANLTGLAATANVTTSSLVVIGVSTVAAGSTAAPSISPTGDSNTGIFFPAADTIAFGEGGSEALRIDSSSNLQFNSGYGSVATAYGCRAWVNFNGTSGSIGSGRANGNVSSITDNGTGDYTVNFTTAMPDANYSVSGCGGSGNEFGSFAFSTFGGASFTTSSCRITVFISQTANKTDVDTVCVAIFR